jgi:hypothetical protein
MGEKSSEDVRVLRIRLHMIHLQLIANILAFEKRTIKWLNSIFFSIDEKLKGVESSKSDKQEGQPSSVQG